MADERTRHLRKLRRRKRGARRWSVFAGTFTGATAVLVPYAGVGIWDAPWAALAGGSAALAFLRWQDYREMRAQPVPPPLDPATAGALARQRLTSAVRRLPVGELALDHLARQRIRMRLRGLSVAPVWDRLDRASIMLGTFAGTLGGPAESAILDATVAERSLRELADRTASVEKALRIAPEHSQPPLAAAHADLMGQLTRGVDAYEALVAAAAGYLAEDGRAINEHPATARLADAADMLRGVAMGLSELRTMGVAQTSGG